MVWTKGQSGNPHGRMVGTRLELSTAVLKDVLADWNKHGKAAIRATREKQPAQYLKICALLVPREVRVEHIDPIKQLSDEALDQVLGAMQARLEERTKRAKLITSEPIEPESPQE